MKRLINPAIVIVLLFLTGSCCTCSDEVQSFTASEKEWIPEGETGDSAVFKNEYGQLKTFYIRQKYEGIEETKCAGPCFCKCAEDEKGYYIFEFTGELIPNTLSIMEGLTINMNKSDNVSQNTFTWSCTDGSFQNFDYYIDTLTINNKLYSDIFVKELDVCNIRKIFFCKGTGLIRFDYVDGIWERIN